jgi:PAS domain-containing protein
MSADEEVLECSEGFAEMTGYDRPELLGKSTRLLSQGCEEELDTETDIRRTAISGTAFVASVLNRHKCGWLYWNTMYIQGLVIGVSTASDEVIESTLYIHHGGAERFDMDQSGIVDVMRRAAEQVRAEIGIEIAITNANIRESRL